MKYPLSFWHRAVRETVCFFSGHNWTTSWERKQEFPEVQIDGRPATWDEIVEMDYHEAIPYRIRKANVNVGNYLYEFKASWRYKCQRCRLRIQSGDAHVPWYRTFKWAVSSGFGTSQVYIKCMFVDYTGPMWKKVLAVGPVAIFGGFAQFWCYFDRLPYFPMTAAHEVTDRLFRWVGFGDRDVREEST